MCLEACWCSAASICLLLYYFYFLLEYNEGQLFLSLKFDKTRNLNKEIFGHIRHMIRANVCIFLNKNIIRK